MNYTERAIQFTDVEPNLDMRPFRGTSSPTKRPNFLCVYVSDSTLRQSKPCFLTLAKEKIL
jgi:hypothetical protein